MRIDKEFFKLWEDKRVAMLCKNRQEAREFYKLMQNNGIKSDNINEDMINYFQDELVFFFFEGKIGFYHTAIRNDYKVLHFSDYKNSNFYTWRLAGDFHSTKNKYLNIRNGQLFLDSKEEVEDFQTHFTVDEFERICVKYHIKAQFLKEEAV